MKISKLHLETMKRIEASVYPPEYQMLQDVDSLAELADYCEGRPNLHVWETGYAIWTKDEIVDLCSAGALQLAEMIKVRDLMKATFKNRVVEADLRETTSYRLCKVLARRGWIEILSEEKYLWGSEYFYSVTLRFM